MPFLHHGYLVLPQTRTRDLQILNSYFTVYFGASPCDRSNTITFPTQMKSIFPLPRMRRLRASYSELCHQRAIDLLKLKDKLDAKMFVFWSGGIDSTCLLACLLEHCKNRDQIVVLLDDHSIGEYPLFFAQHINGKINYQPTSLFPDLLVAPNLIVNGEHNDQLFGSDLLADAIALFGMQKVMGCLQRELITSLFEYKLWGNRQDAEFLSELFERLKQTAPIELRTNFDLLWWINFVIKWQTVYMRPLIFSRNRLTAEYVKNYYQPFFGTENFQLWSMNNLDQRIQKDWRSYKWPAKQVIYQFTGDADYRDNKIKFGSLAPLLRAQPYHRFIDENYQFRKNMNWYRPNSDFYVVRDMRSMESLCDAPAPDLA